MIRLVDFTSFEHQVKPVFIFLQDGQSGIGHVGERRVFRNFGRFVSVGFGNSASWIELSISRLEWQVASFDSKETK